MNLYELKLAAMEDAMHFLECPFCFLDEALYKMYFSRLLNNVLDQDYRTEWLSGGGLCSKHSLMLLEKGSATGQAILYQDLVNNWKKTWLDNSFVCPVCQKIDHNFEDSKKAFIWGLNNRPEFYESFLSSDGLCRDHFVKLYPKLAFDVQELLISVQDKAFGRLNKQLELLLRQHTYNYQGKKDQPSLRSWKKAARYFVSGVEKKYRV